MKKRIYFPFWGIAAAVCLLCGCRKDENPFARLKLSGPPGMTVRVAGQMMDRGPFHLKLSPGTYIFSFQAPGYQPEWKKFVLKKGSQVEYQVRMRPVEGAVLIVSKPERAKVIFGGRPAGVAPLLLSHLAPGNYSAQLQLPGYAERSVSWSISSGRFLPRLEVNLEANCGSLTVVSSPKAHVLIGGELKGDTPFSADLEEGKIQLTLEAEGYLPKTEWITLIRGKHQKIEWKLSPRPSEIRITSEPSGAEVFVNDRKIGVTPCRAESLVPGNYMVKILRDGFDPWTRDFAVRGGSRETLHASLVSSSGSARLHIRPAGVFVSVDGKPMGRAAADPNNPGETKTITVPALAPGKHVLELYHPRANPPKRSIRFEVRKGEQTTCPPCDVWIANCLLTYKSGETSRGFLYYANKDYLIFGPLPGVRIQVNRSDLSKITELSIDE